MSSFYTEEELKQIGFAKVGHHVLISKKVSIYGAENMSIGNHVRIDDFCILSGQIKIANYVHIAAYCALFAGSAGIQLDNFSGLSSRCSLYAVSDDYSGEYMSNPCVPENLRKVTSGKIHLQEHTLVGASSVILPNVTIGVGSSVGGLSLVMKSIPEWGIYFGCPAKKIKNRSQRILELAKEIKE